MASQYSAKYLIIGNGKMALHFAHYLQLLDIEFSQWNRADGISLLPGKIGSCSHILLLTTDSQIASFYQDHSLLFQNKLVIHFSGALNIPNVYGIHPLMTFGPKLYDLETYKNIPFVTSEKLDFAALLPALENKHFTIKPEQKEYYHALCVLGGNFTTLLWQKMFSGFSELGLSAEVAAPYLQQILANSLAQPTAALTGPLARNDQETILKNISSLQKSAYQKIYQSFLENFEGIKKETHQNENP